MHMIIGREKEIEKLEELYSNDKSDFVAVYGRRRVGKTFLISELFENRFSFRHAGLSPIELALSPEKKLQNQLQHFYRSLTKSGMKESKKPTNWLDAFYMLEDFLDQQNDGSKQVVFFDEIQWLDTPKSGFLSALEGFWNNWGCFRHNLLLIVCGSSTSWITNKLINNVGGLYNRLTYTIHLMPFDLYQCEKYLETNHFEISRYDMTELYMVFGGIPYYFNYLDRKLSVSQNINNIFYEDNAPLKNEFNNLFDATFAKPEMIKSIIKSLYKTNKGLTRTEIINATGIPNGGELSMMLNALLAGGFIMKYIPYSENKRYEYYKLVDPFCLFYLHFVNEGKKFDIHSQNTISWRGYAFENVCFNHINQIKQALGINGVVSNEYMWLKGHDDESEGAQIDLVIDRKDNVVNLCEIKFYNEEFSIDNEYHLNIEHKKNALYQAKKKKTATISMVLISTYGLKQNQYRFDFANVIVLDDLFQKAK